MVKEFNLENMVKAYYAVPSEKEKVTKVFEEMYVLGFLNFDTWNLFYEYCVEDNIKEKI